MLKPQDKIQVLLGSRVLIGTVANVFDDGQQITASVVTVGYGQFECELRNFPASAVSLMPDAEWNALVANEPAFDHPAIRALRRYAFEELHGTDLRGYAARDAIKVLLPNWETAIADGCTDNLVADIDIVIDYLKDFQVKAREQLPKASGGLGPVPETC